MEITRREFLKCTAITCGGALINPPIPSQIARGLELLGSPDCSLLEEKLAPVVAAGNELLGKVAQSKKLGPTKPVTFEAFDDYTQAIWYIQNPNYADTDIRNLPRFYAWLRGENLSDTVTAKLAPTYLVAMSYRGIDNQVQTELLQTAKTLVDLLVTRDKSRVSFVVLSDKDSSRKYGEDGDESTKAGAVSRIDWGVFPLDGPKGSYVAQAIFYREAIRRLMHEATHGFGQPGWNTFATNDPDSPGKVLFTGDSISFFANYYHKWVNAIINSFDFIEERFIRSKGDETLSSDNLKIGKDGMIDGNGLIEAIKEWIAMLVPDLLLPSELSSLPGEKPSLNPSDWPPEIKSLVLRTLNYMREGESGWQSELPSNNISVFNSALSALAKSSSARIHAIVSPPSSQNEVGSDSPSEDILLDHHEN